MAADLGSVNVNDAAKRMTLNVKLTGMRRFRIRLWMVKKLLHVIAWIAPFRVEVEGPA